MQLTTCTIGYPRIGPQRQMKSALERHWKGQSSLAELLSAANAVQEAAWVEQKQAGVQLVGADGTLYDHVLDTTYWLGIIPQRFQGLSGHALYFALARGSEGAQALDMSKHFDSNYHHLVPELEPGWRPQLNLEHVLDKLKRCQAAIGKEAAVPMITGPITWCCLAKRGDESVASVVERLLPAYLELLNKIKQLQAPEVQLHEPWLTTSHGATLSSETRHAYEQLAAVGLPINLVTCYDDLGASYPWVVALPVAAVSMDFVGVSGAATPNQSLDLVRRHGFPQDKRLGAGIVDGRSVWADTGLGGAILRELVSLGVRHVSVQPSVSLQHLPLDVGLETQLPAELKGKLGFARQKLNELVNIAAQAQAATTGASKPSGLSSFTPSDLSFDIPPSWFHRSQPFEGRRDLQPQMPAFPTTTIGSFPQTEDVRRLRLHFKQGRITQAAYEAGIAAHIGYAVGVQEALGLDVLVHGEAERTDMVEFFGQSLEGMAFTLHGWVQSYGSRYVRPPLVVSDVKFIKPMTTHEFKVAQGLTRRPMKGMLTGPVTILNWSFPRRDITRKAQAFQLALALREEVLALEAAGCQVVQVDEPALREGLPLKAERWPDYLQWAVEAFRLTTAAAKPQTQVVTHLCYSDFQDIMEAIADMDADVLTIESSRSGDDMVRALAAANYPRDLGAGIYDVHSPVVPTVEFIKDKLRSFLATGLLGGRADRLWVNPDCGLKTRTWDETIPALRNMVQAAMEMRAELAGSQAPGAPVPTTTATPEGAVTSAAPFKTGRNGCSGGACCH